MRIGIDAHMLGDRSGGNESFYEGVLKAFVPDKENEYILFMRSGVDDTPYRDRFKIVRFKSRNAFIRNFVELTILCFRYKLDLLHTQYYIPFIRPCKTVVTIHDVCFEHYDDLFEKHEYYRNKLLIPYSARRSNLIITDSEFSGDDIAGVYGIDKDKICVSYCAADPEFRALPEQDRNAEHIRDKFGIGDYPYIICVGNLQPRKNIPRLIEAFVRYKQDNSSELKLVIVGKNAWQYDKTLDMASRNSEHIVLTGYVTKSELIQLLNEAKGFVYPSYYEGFGIPPLEALNCGTRVAVADIPVMHEVLGDLPVYFDPYDIGDICEAVKELEESDPLQIDEKVAEAVNRFSWSDSAKRIGAAYSKVISG